MLYFLRKAFSFNKAIKRPLAAYRIIPNLLKLEDRITPTTILVTNTGDSNAVGSGSLRAAINLANTTPGDDQISFNLTGASAYTITLASALPTILNVSTAITGGTVGTLTINGLGTSALTINGDNGNVNRDFNIFYIATGGNLAISGAIISGAHTLSSGSSGGGILNGGTLSISNSTISGNTSNTKGGGIYNFGTLSISNSTISGNSAFSFGGGIFNFDNCQLTISNSTISGNSTTSGNWSSGGGASITAASSPSPTPPFPAILQAAGAAASTAATP